MGLHLEDKNVGKSFLVGCHDPSVVVGPIGYW